MREEHFDLLPELHRDLVLVGLCDVPGDLAGVFMFLVRDEPEVHVRAAVRLRMTFEVAPIDISQLAQECVEETTPFDETYGIRFQLSQADRYLNVLGDAGRLKQVIVDQAP